MEWYARSPARWQGEQQIAAKHLKDCRAGFDDQGQAVISGFLPIMSEHGHEYGVFGIRIVYPQAFPGQCCGPSAYLDSHRGQWTNMGESHIESDWRLCLYVPGESEIDFRREDALEDFLACLRTFLFKERIYQRDLLRKQLTGERAEWPGPFRSTELPASGRPYAIEVALDGTILARAEAGKNSSTAVSRELEAINGHTNKSASKHRKHRPADV